MDKKTKKEYLSLLNSDKFYNHALSFLKDESEKKKIKAFAEDVFIQVLRGGLGINQIVREHPEKLADVVESRISKDKESSDVDVAKDK